MKLRPVGAKLLHADRQRDMMKPIVSFRNLAKARKNKVRQTQHFTVSKLY
jgi:hypothetical protein